MFFNVDTLRHRYTCESATLLRAEGSQGDISTGLPKPLRARSLSDKVLTYKGRPTLSGTISEVTTFIARRLVKSLGDDRDER
jgi:hypothetical protein